MTPELHAIAIERVNSGDSQLSHPARFFGDIRRDWPVARVLARRLFLTGVANQYRNSSLGVFWAVLAPAAMALAISLGRRARLIDADAGSIPAEAYVVFGFVMWQVFFDAFRLQLTSISAHQHLMVRQRVPVEGVILAQAGHSLVELGVRVVVVAAVLLLFGIKVDFGSLAALGGLLAILLFGSACGLLLAVFNCLTRDVERAMPVVTWTLLFLTPVFYPYTGEGTLGAINRLNPLTYLFGATRQLAYGDGNVDATVAVIIVAIALVTLIGSYLFARVALPHILERHGS